MIEMFIENKTFYTTFLLKLLREYSPIEDHNYTIFVSQNLDKDNRDMLIVKLYNFVIDLSTFYVIRHWEISSQSICHFAELKIDVLSLDYEDIEEKDFREFAKLIMQEIYNYNKQQYRLTTDSVLPFDN